MLDSKYLIETLKHKLCSALARESKDIIFNDRENFQDAKSLRIETKYTSPQQRLFYNLTFQNNSLGKADINLL